MDYKEILKAVQDLSREKQKQLIADITGGKNQTNYISVRKEQMINKQIGCPHCDSKRYYRFGVDKGSQRFKCHTCKKTFMEYTGTWMAGIHKKTLINDYIELMHQEKSLDKIKKSLSINKKTAFDWRHKILSSLNDTDKDKFSGITESDETFFLLSEKGTKQLVRKPRKRGEKAESPGISNSQVAVIVTTDRKGCTDMTVATMGRITKKNISEAIGNRISQDVILCSDGHVSYKGFARDSKLKHIALRSDLKQRVKEKVYHIQHVNSLHSRVKKWIDYTFQGVSTKYLQNYLNWFRVQEKLKKSTQIINDMTDKTFLDSKSLVKYRAIENKYHQLNATQL